MKVTAIPQQFTAESLAERMKAFGIAGKIFLYPRGNLGREAIVDMLTSFGTKVKTVTVYKTIKPDMSNVSITEKNILEGKIDIVSFMSPSAVKNFFSLFTEEAKSVFCSKTVFAVIGGVTAATMLKLGLSPSITAEPSTVEGMINAIENYYKNRKI
jgi:uroporphyrinogen-III synthase